MAARILDGKKLAEEIKREVKAETELLKKEKGIVPGLAFILVGENPSSHIYVKMKGKGCEEVGFYSITLEMPESTSEEALLAKIAEFNVDRKIHGILVQMPLPEQIREIPGISGIHIMAIEAESSVPALVEKAGLLPRPTV